MISPSFIYLLPFIFCSTCYAIPTSLVTPAPKIPVGYLAKRSIAPNCGYFSGNPTLHVRCNGESTCSSSPGASTWGCCDSSSCYIPATCENANAPTCGGTPAALCPYSPIMKCTYGSSSECLTFIRQTADDDTAKATSWGCGTTPSVFIIVTDSYSLSSGTLSFVSGTPDQTSSKTPSQSPSSIPSPSGLTTGAKAGIGVGVAVGGLIILVAGSLFLYKASKRSRDARARDRGSSAVVVPKHELAEGVNTASTVPTERVELDDSGVAAELEAITRSTSR